MATATVSKWTPFGVALDLTATSGTVTRTSATKFTVAITAKWETYWSGAQTNYGMTASSGGVTKTISAFNGTKRSSGSASFTGTYSISGNGKQTKTVTVTFKNFNTDNGDSATKNISLSVSVPAWTSYTVSYNANGGSGAPGSQTKWKDQTLTLSSTKPTRTGYSFLGWALSKADADVGTWYYQPGGTCGKNENLTLYAVWKANTYKVSYNANGGTGAPGSQTKTYGVALTLSNTRPTRTNYTFLGWATSASATSATYAAGGSYTANAQVTLYAVWKLAYTKPRISGFSVNRCDSEGAISDSGKYALVKFTWACDQNISSIKIERISSSDTYTWNVDASGKSGSVSKIIGGQLSLEMTYTIRVTVTDSGGSYSRSLTLSGTLFPIDVRYGGKGVAFGKPAELDDVMDVNYKARHRKNIILDNNVGGIYGTTTEITVDDQVTPPKDIHLMNLNANNNLVIGYGGYSNTIGATNVYGNVINLQSKDGIFVEGRKIATNNVLWNGGWYMGENQTCTLSEGITKQVTGIILVWSEYNAAAAGTDDDPKIKNANFNVTFVPKRFVQDHSGKGISCHCASATGNIQAIKYVYIKDTTITGYDKNAADLYEATCGITMSPKKFVLRYVIGV